MPPRRFSRYTFCQAYKDDAGALVLTEPEPYRFRKLSDNRQHTVIGGDTLFNLASRYFARFPRAAGLWWVLADYQPEPIVDPTIALAEGSVLIIPSERTVDEIFAEERRAETVG